MTASSDRTVECRSLDGAWQFAVPEGTAVVVGRGPDVDYVVSLPALSRRHASFANRDGSLYVENAGASGDILVNGEIVRGSRALKPGDRVALLSDVVFVVEAENAV